jgi:hypothetical protein
MKFLLKRALGHLLQDDLDLDQLNVQLGQGRVQLAGVDLNVEVWNFISFLYHLIQVRVNLSSVISYHSYIM